MTATAPLNSTTNNPTVWGYHGRLGDLLFRFAVSEREPFTITRAFSQREQINTDTTPEDFTDTFGLTFSQVEFNGGEGRKFAHRPSTREGSTATSFYRSYGLRLNNDHDLEIVNQTEEVIAGAAPDPEAQGTFDRTNGILYLTDGSPDLVTVENLNSDPPTTGTEVTGAVNDLEDVLFFSEAVYVATGTQIRYDQGTGTWTQWSDLNAVRLWRAKNRVIASDGRRLYEDPSGTGVTTGDAFITLPAGEEWVDLVDAGQFVAAVTSGGEVYTFTFDGSTLSLGGISELQREQILAVGALYGVILLMTYQQNEEGGTSYTQRLWRGSFGDDGTFTNLQVIREWEISSLASLSRQFGEIERDSIYWVVDDGTDLSVWRYNLEDDYVMSDLILDGLTGTHAEVIGKLLGRFWVVTANGDVWREDPDVKRTSGTFIGPAIDFFNADPKTWETLKLVADFPTDATVKAYISDDLDSLDLPDDNTAWMLTRTYRSQDDTNTALSIEESRYLAARFVLTGGAVLRTYAIRALPPLSDEEIVLRVNASDDVFRPGKKRQRVEGLGEAIWRKIRDLQGEATDLVLYDLDTVWRGSLVEVGTPVRQYRPDGSLTKVIEIRFRGEPFTTTTISTATWGVALWGEGLWGSNEVT